MRHPLPSMMLALVTIALAGSGACHDGRPSDDPAAVARAALNAYKLRHVERLLALQPPSDAPRVTPTQDTLFPAGKWRTETAGAWDGRIGQARAKASLLRVEYTHDPQFHYVVTLVQQDGVYYLQALDRLLDAEWATWGEPHPLATEVR